MRTIAIILLLLSIGAVPGFPLSKPILEVEPLGLEFKGQTRLSFIGKTGFVADETGLYRFEGPLKSDVELIRLQLTEIENTTYFPETLQAVDGRLFMNIRTLEGNPRALELFSDDLGETFQELPYLEVRGTNNDGSIYMKRYYRSEIFKENGLYYTRPGRSLETIELGSGLAWSDDKGLTWNFIGGQEEDTQDTFFRSQLYGAGALGGGILMTAQAYPQLGYAQISRGVLAPDGKSWEIAPEVRMYAPNDCMCGTTEGLQIDSFSYHEPSDTFYMSRMGILKSTDKGASFHYGFRGWSHPNNLCYCTPLEDYSVPVGYAIPEENDGWGPWDVWFTYVNRDKQLVFAGGSHGYSKELWISYDGGTSWFDYFDNIVAFPDSRWIIEDGHERLLAGFMDRYADKFVIAEIKYRDNLEQLLTESLYVGGGWRHSQAFGWILQYSMPWVWLDDFGKWIWIEGEDPENIYLWNAEKRWMWTSESAFPSVFVYDTSGFEIFK